MAGLGFFKPKATAVDASGVPSLRDLPMQDKLLALSAILSGDTASLQQIPLMAAARQQALQARAAETDLADFVSGKAIPQRPRAVPAFSPEPEAGPDLGQNVTDQVTAGLGGPAIPRLTGNARVSPMADIRLPARSDVADAMGGPVTVRNALPMIAAAARKGVPIPTIKEYREAIQAAQPDIGYESGVRYDKRDPASAPGFVPSLDKGQEPLFDRAGNVVAVRNMDGSVKSAAEMAQAVSGAQERAKAGYDVETYELPGNRTARMTRRQAADALNGQGGVGLDAAPTQADKTRADSDARAASDRDFAAPKAFSGLEAQGRTTDLVIDTLDKALTQIGGGSAGLGELTKMIPGTPARNLDATLDTIRAAIGFDKLQEMRANSPTGGALGAVSDKENKLLQSVMGSLDQGQSPDQLRANLQRLRGQLATVREERKRAYSRQYPNGPAARSAITPEQAREILARRRAARGGT